MESIIDIARNKISAYCLSNCDAECCKRGSIKITENQINLMTKGDKSLLEELPNNEYRVKLTPCINIDGNKCLVYQNRSDVCRRYPIRLINLSQPIINISKCKAIDAGIVNNEINKLSLKYKIIR